MLRDLSLLAARVVPGAYVAGHAAQKLFGAFGGPGIEGAGRHFATLGLEPGTHMARAAGLVELAGGTLTIAGLADPVGPIAVGSTMLVAAATAHRGKGPFAAAGGPELPLTNLAAALALAACGPGRLSLDGLTGLRAPRRVVGAVALGGLATAGALIVRARRTADARAAAERRRREALAPRSAPDYDDGVDEAGRESFPASDPPAWNFAATRGHAVG